MGKLIVRACIVAAIINVIMQFSSYFPAWYSAYSIQIGGILFDRPAMNYNIYLTKMEVVIYKYKFLTPLYKKGWNAAKRAFSEPPKDEKTLTPDQAKQQLDTTTATLQRSGFFCNECMGGNADCCLIDLKTLTNLFETSAIQQLQVIMPDFLGTRSTGQALFWSGMITILANVLIIIGNLLGGVYLYYYSEVKATKNARKGALACLVAALFFSLLVALIGMFVWIFTAPTTALAIQTLVTSRSGTLPSSGYWVSVANMILMSLTLCFSKFWRLRRAEKVRKERKDQEEEEDFLRLLGVDPNAPTDTDSGSDSESESESEDEDDNKPKKI